MKTRMFLTSTLALGGIAIAAAVPAVADDFSGKYAFHEGVGPTAKDFSSVWTVTPCGEGCVHIVTSNGATDTDAHLEGPYWVFEKFADPGVECPGNSYTIVKRKLPAMMKFTINPDTLLGQYQAEGTPCGGVPLPIAFQLAKVAI